MRKVFVSGFILLVMCAVARADFSCGPGYVLEKSARKTDGIDTYECKKLWCMDLETGKKMGSGDRANNGYKMTNNPIELCGVGDKDCITCFGDRRWCNGQAVGRWNAEYGGYTRGGADNATYQSYQNGGCFAWRLDKSECEAGQIAVLQDGRWICAEPDEEITPVRASGMRRTGAIRRIGR